MFLVYLWLSVPLMVAVLLMEPFVRVRWQARLRSLRLWWKSSGEPVVWSLWFRSQGQLSFQESLSQEELSEGR